MNRGRRVVTAIAVAACGTTLLITQEVLPGAIHQPLRGWGLHWIAVLFASLLTWLMLVGETDDRDRARKDALAIWVPFVLLALHELGQWLWPADGRDTFDSLRDLGLNALGALLAWVVVRRFAPPPPPRPPRPPRSRPSGSATGSRSVQAP